MATRQATHADTSTSNTGADASVQKPKRKVGRPGRKKIDTEAKNRRTAQNRAAQRAFRERKEQKLNALEHKIANLEAINEQAEFQTSLLRDHLTDLINEVARFRGTSPRDMEVLELLSQAGATKRALRLENLHEDERIAAVDNVKNANGNYNKAGDAGLSTAAAEAAAAAYAAVSSYVPAPASTAPVPTASTTSIADQLLGKTELTVPAPVSHSPQSMSSGHANSTLNSPQSASNSIHGASMQFPLSATDSIPDTSMQFPLSTSNSIPSSSSSSNMDIIDNLFNAAYSFDEDKQAGQEHPDLVPSSSASSASHTNLDSEYNLTNQFPTFNTHMFSLYGGDAAGNAAPGNMPPFTLNNLTNTWNSEIGGVTPGAFRQPSTSSEYSGSAAKDTIGTVPDMPKGEGETPGDSAQFMSFLNGSLAFPEMDDTVLFKPVPSDADADADANCACGNATERQCRSRSNSCSSAKGQCASAKGQCASGAAGSCGGPAIKCELLTRHILHDESVRSILRDKTFMREGPGSASSTAAACAAGCSGAGCKKVSLPYGPDGRVLQCVDVWRHITTLPKYSDVDIDDLCDELMTKVNYSDEGLTIRPDDIAAALHSQAVA